MTKKDFIKAAQIVKESTESYAARMMIARAFIRLFKGANPRFDELRFLQACGLS